ncbi:MAG TPA: oligosaccharide flippase family protein [Terriglobales bacterium]|nr:oligosaccharide flippase family protein [Terriglobales bacterium]
MATLRSEPAHARVLGGSIIMLVGSGLVSVVNFGYNVAVARMLGPSAFGHAAAAVTLLMLVSAMTLSFQLVCAKFVARNETDAGKSAVYASLTRRAWTAGIMLGSGLILCSGIVARYLNLPTPWVVIILAFGIAFYVPLGAKRGGLQGTCAFAKLSWNFILEAVVKFLGAVVLIQLGYGVLGAVAAISVSVMLAYFFPSVPQELKVNPTAALPASFREGMQAIIFFTGQVIINNIDIILVKHFFSSDQAGMYAAIALVGRVIYFASWSVVSAMFPVSAGAKPKDENHAVLVVPLVIVLAISLVFIVGLTMFPEPVLRAVFGAQFEMALGMEALLSLYAAAAGIYSLGVVLMAYEMSRKIANTGLVQLAVSGAIFLGINIFHSTLHQVVLVQLVLMVALLMIVSLPFFRFRRMNREEAA